MGDDPVGMDADSPDELAADLALAAQDEYQAKRAGLAPALRVLRRLALLFVEPATDKRRCVAVPPIHLPDFTHRLARRVLDKRVLKALIRRLGETRLPPPYGDPPRL